MVRENEKAAEPSIPTKENNTFVGWYSDSELTIDYDFDLVVTKNLTLYTKWEKIGEDPGRSDAEVFESEKKIVRELDHSLADIQSEYSVTDNAQETIDNANAVFKKMLDHCDEMKEKGQIVDYEQDENLIIVQLEIGKYVHEFPIIEGLQGSPKQNKDLIYSEDKMVESKTPLRNKETCVRSTLVFILFIKSFLTGNLCYYSL